MMAGVKGLPLVGWIVAKRNMLRIRWRALLRRVRGAGRSGAAAHLRPVIAAGDRASFLAAGGLAYGAAALEFPPDAPAVPEGRAFRLRRHCLCCEAELPMRVDYGHCLFDAEGRRVPNWREQLVCAGCGMNNRQRLVARLVRQAAAEGIRPRVYLMEQVTPIYEWVRCDLPAADVVGSEYLGHGLRGGQRVRGLRHEDAMNLSFADASFDVIVSNDVMEHVPDPGRVLRECWRVLRPGGTMLATFPFHVDRETTAARARLAGERVEHLLPPEYHGNPVSPEGSLVFHDFGWDLLDAVRDAGFSSAACECYAADAYGHPGGGLLVFRLRR